MNEIYMSAAVMVFFLLLYGIGFLVSYWLDRKNEEEGTGKEWNK